MAMLVSPRFCCLSPDRGKTHGSNGYCIDPNSRPTPPRIGRHRPIIPPHPRINITVVNRGGLEKAACECYRTIRDRQAVLITAVN